MKTSFNLLKDQRGMTGLETAIILIAFVTVAAVFSYAVLSAGLFSAERGKETIYSGLQEARSNLEVCGSVMATSTDSTNVSKLIFTIKNAIAGTPIDMTACDGTSSAANKCVISLTTSSDYMNNVKWTRTAVGANDGDNLLEPGEMFEISVNMADLGVVGTLSDNLTANKIFSLQVKPALGSSVTVQRTLPASISSVMDLDLGIGGSGGSGSGSGGSTGGGTVSLQGSNVRAMCSPDISFVGVIYVNLTNEGTAPITFAANAFSISSDGGTDFINDWSITAGPSPLPPGQSCEVGLDFNAYHSDYPPLDLNAGETFTLHILPGTSNELNLTRTLPDPLIYGTMPLD